MTSLERGTSKLFSAHSPSLKKRILHDREKDHTPLD